MITDNRIKPMKFWCQKVLPLVYDDSLSYYEQVCKVSGKVNELIGIINDKLETYIRQELDKMFIDAMYDAETETLILTLGIEEE